MSSPAGIVVAAALAEWRSVVRDAPSGYAAILRYYRDGLGWTWQKYPAPGAQWCGAFAAECWRRAGLDKQVRYKRMAGVTRLLGWCRGEQGQRRVVEPDAIEPGDIVLIGGLTPNHIAIAVSPPDDLGRVWCIEGNGVAELGDHTTGEGVVRRLRPTTGATSTRRHIHFGIRPLEADLTTPARPATGA